MGKTSIEWADETLNDQAGCKQVSEACKFCYAIRESVRQANMRSTWRYQDVTNGDLRNPQWSGVVNTDLDERRRNFKRVRGTRTEKRWFYGSMTDIWHEDIDIDGVELRLLADEVRTLTPDKCRVPQVVMFLTKRPSRLLAWQRLHFPEGLPGAVWVGTTVETQARAMERVKVLTQVKARVRFLSCEPVFGEIDIDFQHAPNLEWIIAGGESGQHARPADPDWFRHLRDQSFLFGIPFFFKQWGEWDEHRVRVGKKKAGRTLDGKVWSQHPPQLAPKDRKKEEQLRFFKKLARIAERVDHHPGRK